MDFDDTGREVAVRLPLNLIAQNITELRDTVGFQVAPNLRGTLDILWSCFAVLFASVYISSHPNLSEHFDWATLKTIKQNWFIKVFGGLGGVMAPEDSVKHAVREYISCRQHYKWMKARGLTSRWTVTHSYLLEMNGLSLRFPNGDLQVIDRPGLSILIDMELFNELDIPTEDEVHDKSKADAFVKVVGTIQIVWLIIQVIARILQKLPVTLLELMTAGYAFCTAMSYFFWLQKPYRIEIPFVVHCTSLSSRAEFLKMIDPEDDGNGSRWRISRIRLPETRMSLPKVAGYAMDLLLAGLNLVAWEYPFLTPIEQKMWRILSLLHVSNVGVRIFADLLGWVCCDVVTMSDILRLVHWVCRLLFFGLTIGSIRGMPAGSYVQPAWTTFIPHIG